MKKGVLTCAAVVGVLLSGYASAARAATVVTNPPGSQTIVYVSKTASTIFRMAAGATGKPFQIESSNGADVFSVASTGAITTASGISAAANKFSVAATTGNTAVGGTLHVTGATALVGATTLTGALAANGGATIKPAHSYNNVLTVQGTGNTQAGDFIDVKNSGNDVFAVTSNGEVDTYGEVDISVGNGDSAFSIDGSDFGIDSGGNITNAAGTYTSSTNGTAIDVGNDGSILLDGGNVVVQGGAIRETNGAEDFWQLQQAINSYDLSGSDQTLSSVDIIGNRIAVISNASGGHVLKFDTANHVVGSLPGEPQVNDAFSFKLVNQDGTNAATIGPNTGVTLSGGTTIPAGGSYIYYCVITSTNFPSDSMNCF